MIVAHPISATVCFCACHVYPHTGYKGVAVRNGRFRAQATTGGVRLAARTTLPLSLPRTNFTCYSLLTKCLKQGGLLGTFGTKLEAATCYALHMEELARQLE